MLAVFKKEMRSYFTSVIGYVFLVLYLAVSGAVFCYTTLFSMRETWVQSLGREDPLEKGKTTYSSILGWRIQWTEEPSALLSMKPQRVGRD